MLANKCVFVCMLVCVQGYTLLLDVDDVEKKVLAVPEENRWEALACA